MARGGGVHIIVGDALTELRKLPRDSVDMICTSPPYWGLRCYGVDGQLGQEPTLGEHLAAMVEVLRECRRVLKPSGTCFVNYGDCYATSPNGRSAAETKAAGNDDRTFRDKPFSTVGPIYVSDPRTPDRRGSHSALDGSPPPDTPGRIVAGGYLKPKDLCMVPQRLFIALQEDGWWVRSIMPWVKRNGMPESISDRPANSIEYVAFLTKSPRYWWDAEAVRRVASSSTYARLAQDIEAQSGSMRANGGRKTNVVRNSMSKDRGRIKQGLRPAERFGGGAGFRNDPGARLLDRNFRNTDLFFDSLDEPWGLISDEAGMPIALDVTPQPFREAHFATFPPGLVDPLVRAGCPPCGTVLDPFFGAGTTGLVADGLQRNCIGIELNPEYAQIARRRIDAARGGLLDAMEAVA
jgi:DNA modification methylase